MPRRPTLTCKRCRERRVRCDKKKPCLSCIKHKAPHLCVYESTNELHFPKGNSTYHIFKIDQKKATKDVINSQLVKEFDNNKNGVGSEDRGEEIIDFYEHFNAQSSSQYVNNGPLSWNFVEEIEPALCKLKKYILLLNFISSEDEMKLQEPKKGNFTFNAIGEEFSTFDSIRQKLISKLPENNKVWESVSDFFKWIYPYMPFFDQISFCNALSRILGEVHEDNQNEMNISKNDDLAILGIVSLMIHLSLLLKSLQFNEGCSETLKSGAYAFEAARLCYKHYQLSEQLSVPILQLSMTIRMYQRFAPEFREGVYNVTPGIYISLLLQTAYSLGLNRDPIDYPPRERNLRRKLWRYLLLLDINESFINGTPLFSNTIYYNTISCSPEEIDENSSNILDLNLEKDVVSFLLNLLQHLAPQIEILNMTLSLKGGTKIKDFLNCVSSLEVNFFSHYTRIEGINIPLNERDLEADIYKKSHRLKMVLGPSVLFLSIYLHLMVFFENKNDQEKMLDFQLRIQELTLGKMMSLLFSLSQNLKEILGPSGVLLVNSYFYQFVYRSAVVNITVLYRLKFHLHNIERIYASSSDQSSISVLLQEAISNLKECVRCTLDCLESLRGNYYMTIKTKKILDLYLRVIDRHELYALNIGSQKLGKICYTPEFLVNLNRIYVSTLSSRPKKSPLSEMSSDDSVMLSDFDFDFDFSKVDKAIETLSGLDKDDNLMGSIDEMTFDPSTNFLFV